MVWGEDALDSILSLGFEESDWQGLWDLDIMDVGMGYGIWMLHGTSAG